jgi:hypothetical protein
MILLVAPELLGSGSVCGKGLISPITFIVSLFNDNVNIYEVHNNGNWYNLGFMLGVACVFSGGAGAGNTATGRRRSRRSER